MARRRKKFIGQCAYCETEGRLTLDHVIPECLFENGKAPADAPIVYACAACNNTKKNQDDSYLRDMLVMDMQVYGHPIATQIFQGPVRRAARAKGYVQSPLARMVQQDRGRKVSVTSPSGIYLGEAYGIALPADRVWRIFSTLARGLYLAYTDKRIPEGVRYSINRAGDAKAIEETVRQIATGGGAYRQAGDGRVFQCVYGVAQNRPDLSIWFLAFYQQLIFVVSTEHPDLPELDESGLVTAP